MTALTRHTINSPRIHIVNKTQMQNRPDYEKYVSYRMYTFFHSQGMKKKKKEGKNHKNASFT